MFSKCSLLGALLLFSVFINAQCDEDTEERVLLVGDSWAFFMNVDRTINNVLSDWGHTEKRYYTNTTLSENGARITDFLQADKQDEIATQLQNRPTIDYVHLSIGGNDVLGNWEVSFTEEEVDSLKDEVMDNLIEIIEFIKDLRPDIKILWSGYVYTNFQEVIEGFLFPSNHPFYSTWSGMEYPDNATINQILIDFSEQLDDYFANDDRVDFFPVPGLMQYTFGQNNPLGVEPFGTYPAFEAPLPNGYPEYPSPQNSMRDYALTKDCFHLSAKGYYDLISYHTQKYYHKELMDRFVLAEGNIFSGTISSENEVSSDLLFGSNSGVTQQPILHFPTNNFPDSIIKRASIYLHIKDEVGNNPFDEAIEISMKQGFFGENATVSSADLNDAPTVSGSPCVFGNIDKGNWVRVDIPSSFYPYLMEQYSVEFLLHSESSGLVEISGTDDSEFAPVFEIQYDRTASNEEVEIAQGPVLNIFPNPTQGIFTIKLGENELLEKVVIIDAQGRVVHEGEGTTFDIANEPNGLYLVKVFSSNTFYTSKLLKN